MAEIKTKPTAASVDEFLARVPDAETRQDCDQLVKLLQAATGEEPRMWGPSIVGFGTLHYVYESGREGDWPLAGFSPRKKSLSLYLSCDIQQHQDLLDKLGSHSCGKGCLYLKRLSEVHVPTLKKLIREAVKETKKLATEMAKKSKSRSK